MASPTITRFRGDTKADLFTIKTANGNAVDITGFTFIMTVNDVENPDGGTPGNILMALVGSITDAFRGEVEFAPTAMEADQVPGSYFYDVEMTDVATRITTIAKGSYVFNQDISK